MKLDVKIQLLVFFSTLFNFIFLALGLSVFFCGVWILFDRENLLNVLPLDELHMVGAGLLFIGAVAGVVSVVGFLAAVKENKLLLLMFLGVLIVLVLAQLFITLLLFLSEDTIKNEVDATLMNMIERFNGSRGDGALIDGALIDSVQRSEKCCGIEDSSDWLKNWFIQNQTNQDLLPCSCFNLSRPITETWCWNEPDATVHPGCKDKVASWLSENMLTIKLLALILIFIQVALFSLVASLYQAVVRKAAVVKRPPLDSDHAPLDHAPEEDLTNGEQNYAYDDFDDDYLDPAHPERLHDDGQHHDPEFHNNNRF